MNFKPKGNKNKKGFYNKKAYYNEWLNTENYNNYDNKDNYVNQNFYYDTFTQQKSDYDANENNDTNYDEGNVRIITREVLYEDIDFIHEHEDSIVPDASCSTNLYEDQPVPYSSGYDWTQQNWLKTGMEASQQGRLQRPVKKKLNREQRKLVEALRRPAEMSKAESMMLKMGWTGGALGKTGEGIVVPIAPNMTYTSSNVGFGQLTIEPKPKKTKRFNMIEPRTKRKLSMNQNFLMNVLQTILYFIKNDLEVEIAFDAILSKRERKMIHTIVQNIYGHEVCPKNYDSTAQLDLMKEINNNSIYTLTTYSVGEDPNRTLYVCKEAPDHIYLITPDDLVPIVDPPDDTQNNGESKQKIPKRNSKESLKQKNNINSNTSKIIPAQNNTKSKNTAAQKGKTCQEAGTYKNSNLNANPVETLEDLNIDVKKNNTNQIKNDQTNSNIDTVLKLNDTNHKDTTQKRLIEDSTQIKIVETEFNIPDLDTPEPEQEFNEDIDKVNEQKDDKLIQDNFEVKLDIKMNVDNEIKTNSIKANDGQTNNFIDSIVKNTDQDFAKDDSNVINTDQDFAKDDSNVINTDQDFAKDDSNVINTDQDFAKDDSNVKNTDQDFAKDDSNVKNTDQDFAKDDSNVINTDQDFAKDDSNVKNTDQDFAKDDSNVKNTDQDFAKDDSNVKNTDRDFAKDDSVAKNMEFSNEIEDFGSDESNIPVPYALQKLIEYFIDFASDEYKEMRFLGLFDSEQTDLINNFVDNIEWCIKKIDNVKSLFHYKKDEMLGVMECEGYTLEVGEDEHGGCVIYKWNK